MEKRGSRLLMPYLASGMNETRDIRLERIWIAIAAIVCFAIAESTLFVRNYLADLRSTLLTALVLLVLCGITNFFAREGEPREPLRDRRPSLQIWVCLFIIALTGVVNVIASGTFSTTARSSDVSFRLTPGLAHDFGLGWFQFGLYVVFTATILCKAGADLRGFGLIPKWHSTIRPILLWVIPMAILLATAIAAQRYPVGDVGLRLLQNFFQNGFSEEFLFRGALLTRLRLNFSEPAANAIQAALFGLWHFGPIFYGTHGDFTATLSLALAGQAVFGAAMGFLALRLGSIALPTVMHTLFDTWFDISRG